MDMPMLYQINDYSFCIQPSHRPDAFEIQHVVGGEYVVIIKPSPGATECHTEALLKIKGSAITVRQQKGAPLGDQDMVFLGQLPKMLSFLGIEDAETKKFNELFYGLFWESVQLKA